MKTIFVVAAILALSGFVRPEKEEEAWIDYRLVPSFSNIARDDPSTTPGTTDPVQCTVPGPKCADDCKSLYLCRRVGDEWMVELLDECENTCNKDRCSTTESLECALKGKVFKCVSEEGMYPDPGSCKNFHYCVPPQTVNKEWTLVPSSCKSNFAYNPRTTYCDIPLLNGTCGNSIVPSCINPGQTGAIKENPTLYYICRRYDTSSNVLYPFLYLCKNGMKYDEKTYSCKK